MSESPSVDNELAFWLSENDCVRVDDRGYLIDRPREGAFGVVVPLWDKKFSNKRALKLPRLRGDTMDENARTWQMLEDEIVNSIAATPSTHPIGLAKPIKELTKLLKGVRQIPQSDEVVDPVQKQKHVVLVSFENGKPPRLCAVSVDSKVSKDFRIDQLNVFPTAVKVDLVKTLYSIAKWKALEFGRTESSNLAEDKLTKVEEGKLAENEESDENSQRFKIPAYCRSASSSSDGRLENALRPNEIGTVWYAGLPGLVYDWSESTLQESIDSGIIKGWSPTSVVVLFESLLGGLATLHRTILHGDLRPANIMCMDGDKHDPSRYMLIDFGSFIDTSARIGVQAIPSNNTVLAARMIKNRISVFYSPERRQPFEVEGVTTAIIKKYQKAYTVILGRESMLDINSQAVAGKVQMKPDIEKAIEETTKNSNSDSDLQASGLSVSGDLLRVQERLLTIVEEKRVPEYARADVDRILVCNTRIARIFNDRIAVLTKETVDDHPMSVSGYTIIPKMSVADDLYSFGSICLYVLLSKAFQDNTPERETVQAATNRAFIALMGTLDNVAYATAFWKTTEALRPYLEDVLRYSGNLTADKAPKIYGFDLSGMPVEVAKEPPEDQTLFERSVEITDTILQNLPYGQHIYSALGQNTASFVLWMHFVICCLHRADRIKTELATSTTTPAGPDLEQRPAGNVEGRREARINKDEILPFCSSRADGLGSDGPSAHAKERLTLVKKAIEQCSENQMLVNFKYESKAVFKPKSELQMRLQELELQKELDEIKRSKKATDLELRELKANLQKSGFLFSKFLSNMVSSPQATDEPADSPTLANK